MGKDKVLTLSCRPSGPGPSREDELACRIRGRGGDEVVPLWLFLLDIFVILRKLSSAPVM